MGTVCVVLHVHITSSEDRESPSAILPPAKGQGALVLVQAFSPCSRP